MGGPHVQEEEEEGEGTIAGFFGTLVGVACQREGEEHAVFWFEKKMVCLYVCGEEKE